MEQTKDEIEDERILNNAAYRRLIPQLIKDHEGEQIVISTGELIEIFTNRQDASLNILNQLSIDHLMTIIGRFTTNFTTKTRPEFKMPLGSRMASTFFL